VACSSSLREGKRFWQLVARLRRSVSRISPSGPRLPLPAKPSIAVLHLLTEWRFRAREFSDGMTEDSFTDLSKLSGCCHRPQLRVTYKGQAVRPNK